MSPRKSDLEKEEGLPPGSSRFSIVAAASI
jgi:hypothetical protein